MRLFLIIVSAANIEKAGRAGKITLILHPAYLIITRKVKPRIKDKDQTTSLRFFLCLILLNTLIQEIRYTGAISGNVTK